MYAAKQFILKMSICRPNYLMSPSKVVLESVQRAPRRSDVVRWLRARDEESQERAEGMESAGDDLGTFWW